MEREQEVSFLGINPVFLFILFAIGYVFGLLLRNPSAGKFLIFGFFGIFIYQPVRDAGLLASACFLIGIIAHHVSLSDIFDAFSQQRTRRPRTFDIYEEGPELPDEEQPKKNTQQQKNTESAEETHQKYQEYVNKKRREQARKNQDQSDNRTQKAHKKSQYDSEREELKKAAERVIREQEKINAERAKFRQEQASYFSPDTRTHEEILGLSGSYTFDDLKKARSYEAKRWNPSNMVNKPAHLVKQAEDEMKKINIAFDELKKKFTT